MEGPRAPKSEEFNDLVKFLDTNLRDQNSWSIADEYPTTMTLQNLHNVRIIKDENGILSHAVIKPTIVKTRRGLFKVGCLGSVVTQEAYRNQGLSQNVLNDCVSAIQAQGCDIAILWTNQYDFYRKMGFELAGSEVSLLIDRPLNLGATKYKIIQNNRVDAQVLFRLYSQHTVSSIRTLEDFEKYLRIPNSRLYTAWNAEGKVEAFAVEGKGVDLQGYIHEWGGSVDALLALINHIRVTHAQPITVISPSHATNLIRKLESFGVNRVEGFLGMIKITNAQSLFNKVIRSARQEWGIENFVLEHREGFYYFGVGKNIFKTDQETDIVRILFGPQKPSQLHDCGPEANAILDKILPLEMWLWGWDSV
ncbi:MAG: GNAT family N-acetyltransferase [Oligoflexia bacterium]|nr:GNAT family N-acetyltransferase [Oligoflexia bacterium]